MTREEAIKTIKENCCAMCAYASHDMDSCDIRGCDNKDAIKALKQEPVMPVMYYPQVEGITPTVVEPCTDAISRQAVFDIVEREQFKGDALSEIEKLPPVKPTEKVGHWEWVQYEGICGNWHCSECRTIIPHMPENTDNTPIYKWCPMCGVKMASPTGAESEEE